MYRCSFGIYPAWCSLCFQYLYLGFCYQFGNYSFLIDSNISSVSFLFFFLLLVFLLCSSYIFCNCPAVLGYPVLFYSLFSRFSFLEVSTDISSSSLAFLSCVQSTKKPTKDILHFDYSVFNLKHCFLIFS